MSSPTPPDSSPSPPKKPLTFKPVAKASDDRVAPFTSLFGPFTISKKTLAPELVSSPTSPPPATTYSVKAIYINAPSEIVDMNYRGTHEQTKQALEGLIDQARTGNRTTDEGEIEHIEGSECNVRVADDGLSFEVFPFEWEGWVARVWAEEKDGDGGEYRAAFGW
ncbi:hypothetical protein HBI56_055800 [Parastagonospora nodorum]|nr:hypothetical protein HBH53_148810 [Parastagonospora nodorum]KAH3966985.1 hypothetical protein HBH51_140200 [Parastagonospora nodorum]KAH3981158.1 hypothetical protein HBH52_084080 [Parastagonospora nodorum]KAH4003253.1 hypothetical protein HBI10_068780 [Parastagonospora nodorum]KAH4026934.1 hypothetical protein HBI09_146030 [Parastagonospora nodorum]